MQPVSSFNNTGYTLRDRTINLMFISTPQALLIWMCIYFCDFSGLRRVSPTSRKASTGGRTLFVTWLTTM
jgi:hypothetical protein